MSKTLIIHVDEASELACDFILQDRSHTLKSGIIESSVREWSKGKRGLWILASHTAMKRKIGVSTDSDLVLDIPTDSSPYIEALFDTASRDTDKSRSDRKSAEHWILGIFDQNPREVYLKAFQDKGRKLVTFTSNVNISIRWNKTGKTCTFEELRRLRDFWIRGGSFYIKSIFTTVRVVTNSGIVSLKQDSIDGFLTTDCSVAVEITSTFRAHFCVLWIDSGGGSFCLHPHPDDCLEIPPSTFVPSGNGGRIVIPEKDYLPITTGAGVETCIALWKEKAFTVAEVKTIMLKIGPIVHDPANPRLLKAPRYSHGHLNPSVPKKKSKEDASDETRLGKPRSQTAWEKAVTKELKGLGDGIQFFHIPNKTPS